MAAKVGSQPYRTASSFRLLCNPFPPSTKRNYIYIFPSLTIPITHMMGMLLIYTCKDRVKLIFAITLKKGRKEHSVQSALNPKNRIPNLWFLQLLWRKS
jgi:hypothetical protein